jgi:hypothetical protein
MQALLDLGGPLVLPIAMVAGALIAVGAGLFLANKGRGAQADSRSGDRRGPPTHRAAGAGPKDRK